MASILDGGVKPEPLNTMTTTSTTWETVMSAITDLGEQFPDLRERLGLPRRRALTLQETWALFMGGP